jgi:hypothetical protein
MYIGLPVKYPLFLSDLFKLEFSRNILENNQISDFMKIIPVGAELFHATDIQNGQAERRTWGI